MQLPLQMKIAGGSAGLFVFGIIFGWILFPMLLKHGIAKQLALKPGSEMRTMNSKIPFPLDFRVFLFNVTNPQAVQNGDTPVLDEIGPYFYEEWKEKVDAVDNEQDDTMTFRMRNTFIFNQAKSGRLTGDEIVTIPHPIIVGPAILAKREKPAMLGLLNKAFTSVFHADTIFLTAPVKDILFDGVNIYCNVSDFAAKGFCTLMRTEAKDLKHITENIFSFSFFGPKNGTDPRKMTIKRGIKNVKDVGRVVEFDGKKDISVWGAKPCDNFEGTDTTIFPPGLKEEEGLQSFAADICRSLPANFAKNVKYKGIPARLYTANFGDMSKNKDEKCFCSTPETCLKKGTMDLSKCVGAPIVASLPHFFDADQSYVEGVRGLRPNFEEHAVYIYFEPRTGTPMEARKRLQFSIPLEKIDKLTLMKTLPETLLPIFWVEEGVALGDVYIKQIKNQLLRVLKIVSILKWTMIVGGIAGLVIAAFLHYKSSTATVVTPTYNNGKHVTNGINTVDGRY